MNQLYTDNHPETTVKGTGFKDKQKALDTIKIVEKAYPKNKQNQMRIILANYYRAMYHPHRNKNMEEAMKIFKKWLSKYK
jgi:hypothetical protein